MQSSEYVQLSESGVRQFIKFMHSVKCAIGRQEEFGSPEKLEMCPKELESQLGLVNRERGKLSKRSKEYQWILEHKEVTHFKIRQCFALKMLREGRHTNEELYEMHICRFHLFLCLPSRSIFKAKRCLILKCVTSLC
ncbi:hypothetical protein MTR67_039549 [Solanum verrucosum]|uniref:Uncharacterized protein n=1 Tax=Solanum verrucosum TaxID=315347 RepID=A0AAF0UHW9_SOLVR|nr:hypothetical protein MTR67_039549 [Solanum verrucosum]